MITIRQNNRIKGDLAHTHSVCTRMEGREEEEEWQSESVSFVVLLVPPGEKRGYRANVDLARLRGVPWRIQGSCEKWMSGNAG